MMNNWIRERILGCMIGGTVGDALGFPVGAYTYEDIKSEFGPKGIHRYKLNEEGMAVISDDTQMSLFTANGILLKWSAENFYKENLPYEHYIEKAYLEWLMTQQKSWIDGHRYGSKCWLSQVRELYVSRGSRTTCLSALCSLAAQEPVENESSGCGGLMRIAPIGVLAALQPEKISATETVRLGAEVARITHKHPLGYLPAGWFAYLLRKILLTQQPTPQSLIETLEEGYELLAAVYPNDRPHLVHLKQKVDQAIALTTAGKADVEVFPVLGEGWVAEENFAIAIYCVLRHWGNFEDAVVAAVNHSGDSASTGAVTGNLIGAIVGKSDIPEDYKFHLELLNVVTEITMDLIKGVPYWLGGMTPELSVWLQKYKEAIWPIQTISGS